MRTTGAALAIGLLLASSAPAYAQQAAPETRSAEERRVDRWSSPRLTRFRSEREFRRYLRDLRDTGRFAPPMPPPVALPPAAPQYAPPSPGAAPPPSPPSAVVQNEEFTLSGAANVEQVINTLPQVIPGATDNPQITNVQERGVDEGDIIKQVGRYLLVLQDGRIFSIDTRAGGGDGLALVDRFNVYRTADDDSWYDEMLVYGDRVVVTGYSYDEEAAQISVMRVGSDGRLRDEGTFLISSNDYFDEDNYATRLTGDRLVIYTPIALSEIDLDEPWEWPAVRRWRREEARETPRRGRPVMDARSVYRPLETWPWPVIHSVSICRLGDAVARGDELDCETRAFVGPEDEQMYVTPSDIWLWTSGETDAESQGGCSPAALADTNAARAWLYRMPLSGRGLRVAGVRGEPVDQLSMAAIGGNFHALAQWQSRCGPNDGLRFATIPLSSFRERLRDARGAVYVPVPEVGQSIENRFTDSYLVYGGRSGHGSYPPTSPIEEPSRIAVVPVARPGAAQLLPVPHSILRAERAGSDIVLTGYRDDSGLDVSLVDLGAAPRIASTVRLDGRYETEGRSHAFNSSVGGDGRGLMGIPTAPRAAEAGRFVWRSGASDVSYLSVDPAGRLAPLGELRRGEAGEHESYDCEVSCIDWYGNSRPIFTGGRVFALTGTELIEGRVEDGRVRELHRLDLTAPPPRQR